MGNFKKTNRHLLTDLFSHSVIACGILGMISQTAYSQVSRSSATKENRAIVYHGKLVRPNGKAPTATMPVTVKVYSPEPSLCLLWAESQTADVVSGGFSIVLGYDVNRLAGAAGGAASNFKQSFINNSSLTISNAQCSQGTSYTPALTDDRLIFASFEDGENIVEVTGLPIKSVPFALQAEEIGGYGLSNLMKISGAGSSIAFTPIETQNLKSLLSPTASDANKIIAINSSGNGTVFKSITAGSGVTLSTTAGNIQITATGTGGTVTSVTANAGPISVSNSSTSPTISISQSSSSTDGYLNSTDWSTFNNKLSTSLASGKLWVGNASGIATPQYLSVADLRKSDGTSQFTSATCTASQTLNWSAITDTFSCASIAGLDAAVITTGTISSSRLPSSANLWQDGGSGKIYYNGGNVGIGVTSPQSKFVVNGVIRNSSSVSVSSGTVDFDSGNLQYTSSGCGSYALYNMKDGAAYTFAVKGTAVATCSFTAYSDSGTTALTVHLPPDHGATITSKHTLYNFLVLGADVYVSWTPGY